MITHSVYDEVAIFMANMNPEKVINFKPSFENQNRFDILMDKNFEKELSSEEKNELNHYLVLNRIIGLAKAQALNIVI